MARQLSDISLAKMYETVADIAYEAGRKYYYSGNSREDMQHFIYLATKFHEKYAKHIEADWELSKDYMDEIEKFINKELKIPSKLMLDYPHAFDVPWDNIEIERCREDKEQDATYPIHDENDEQPGDFYSVYAHMTEGGVMCIADVPTEKDAIDLRNMLARAVQTYKDNGYLKI